MIEWLQSAWDSLVGWFAGLWKAFKDFMSDLGILVLEQVLNAVATIIEAIPIPSFMTTSLSDYLMGIDPSVTYFLSRSGFVEALGILGLGVVFRLSRKLATLGRW